MGKALKSLLSVLALRPLQVLEGKRRTNVVGNFFNERAVISRADAMKIEHHDELVVAATLYSTQRFAIVDREPPGAASGLIN